MIDMAEYLKGICTMKELKKFENLVDQELVCMRFIDEQQCFFPDEEGYMFFVPSRLVWEKFKDFIDRKGKE